jgi:hypothetical protein
MFDDIEQQFQAFYQHILEKSESELSDWILDGFSTSVFDPVYLFDEPSAPIQLQRLYSSINDRLKRKIRNALLLALSKWSLTANKPELLRNLVIFGALIRTPEVIDFIRMINRDQVLLSLSSSQYLDIMGVLIAVVSGFAPLPKAKTVLEDLFTSTQLDFRFAGQLFLGLCACDPESYYKHVPRFLNLINRSLDEFRLDFIFAEFVRVVTLRTIGEHLRNIDHYYQVQFIRYLTEEKWSPALLFPHDRGYFALRANPLFKALGSAYMNDTQSFPIGHLEKVDNAEEIRKYYMMVARRMDNQRGDVQYLGRLASTLQ